jgi:acyl-CoA synthetase (AMP-forming)/AMP-acid ligase II
VEVDARPEGRRWMLGIVAWPMTAKLFSVDTFTEFERKALVMADVLAIRGVTSGTRVMLKAGNSPGFVGGLLALMHLGASIVLLDQQEKADESERVPSWTSPVGRSTRTG